MSWNKGNSIFSSLHSTLLYVPHLFWRGDGFREEVPVKERSRTQRHQNVFCFTKVKFDMIDQTKKIKAKLCGGEWWAVKKFQRVCRMQAELSLLHLLPCNWTLGTRTPETVATGNTNVSSIVCVPGAVQCCFLMTLSAFHVLQGGLAWEKLGHAGSPNYKRAWEVNPLALWLCAREVAVHGFWRTEWSSVYYLSPHEMKSPAGDGEFSLITFKLAMVS